MAPTTLMLDTCATELFSLGSSVGAEEDQERRPVAARTRCPRTPLLTQALMARMTFGRSTTPPRIARLLQPVRLHLALISRPASLKQGTVRDKLSCYHCKPLAPTLGTDRIDRGKILRSQFRKQHRGSRSQRITDARRSFISEPLPTPCSLNSGEKIRQRVRW